MLRAAVGVGFLLATVAGCGSETETKAGESSPSGDAGPPEPSLSTEGGDAGDPNGTFEKASPITVDGTRGGIDLLEGPSDFDYFSFEGTEGEWVSIESTHGSPFVVTDTPLALFDAEQRLLASNTYVDSIKGENVLARIVTRLPAEGTYFVLVHNPNAPSGAQTQPYTVSVHSAAERPGYTVNEENGGTRDGATPAAFRTFELPPSQTGGTPESVSDAFLVGALSSRDDVDVFALDIPTDGGQLLFAVNDSTPAGDGSTSPAGRIWVTEASGKTVLARIDNSTGQTLLDPPLPAGRALLWVAHPDAAEETNDFYVIRALLGADNPVESADDTNGTLRTAEVLEPSEYSGGARLAYVTAHVGTDDIDYFRFDAAPGQQGSVHCVSTEAGSGLVGFHVAIRDERDRTLSEGTETTTTPISLENVPLPASGTFYVRLSKDAQLDDVAGDFARCEISSK